MTEHGVEDLAVPVACPHCGYRTRTRIGGLKQNAKITCSSCGERFYIDNPEFEREVAKLARAVEGFVRRLRAVY
jgi:transcription elongation factor Elf1